MKKQLPLIMAAAMCAMTAYAQDAAPAFPGAEGYGRYTTGGRGGKVVHVTNLNDSGKGSLREAVSGSANKTVVFDVSGIIELKSDLVIGDNTTIAGQTAPGEGITIRYFTVRPGANNIWRFIRIRRGQEVNVNDGADATWQRQKRNIILDHCSFSWSIDEVASFYDNRDFTMQWCTVAEGLANPGHSKGEHSYGGIWGGKGASFHHNFLAHIQNRAPRFNGARYGWEGYDKGRFANTVDAERVDFRNCVMYNWGKGNGCYGGPGGGYINIVNNYYKAGPSTTNKTRVTQVSVASSSNADSKHPELYGLSSRYYVNGNYVTAAANPDCYDWSGVIFDGGLVTIDGDKYIKDPSGFFGQDGTNRDYNGTNCVKLKLDAPIDRGVVTTHSALSAYDMVLAYCGASLIRDGVDARLMEEARTGTTTYKGSVTKMGGILDVVADQGDYVLASESRSPYFDTDGDGIPNYWEIANGLNPDDAADGKLYTLDAEKGWYTNLEVYLNSLVEDIIKSGNQDALEGVDEYYPTYVNAGIADIMGDNSSAIVAFEYYTLDGIRLNQPVDGVSIRRIIYADGHVVTDKVLKK